MPPSPESLPFRQLVDAAPDGRIVAEQGGGIVLANLEAQRMFGYRRDELTVKPIETLVPDRLRAGHPAHVKAYHAAPRLRPMGSGLDLHGRRKDGSEFPVEISLSPIDHEGARLVVAGIRDVSDRRAVEREARRANAYLISAVVLVVERERVLD